MLQPKQPILSEVSEIRNGYVIVREGDAVQVYNLAWYRTDVDRSMVERRPGGGGDAA
ncbi:MAG: hypothetical protein K6T78_15835 [Alicyclobacillus sp.]|nr:hypothetical protein [Alicyclobacillus sp.]